jgi:hypothetical protein
MRRIVDDNWAIKYPPYMSPAAKVRAWGAGGQGGNILVAGALWQLVMSSVCPVIAV